MCHAKIWNLDCGHTRIVYNFCPEAFFDVRTGLSVPCGTRRTSSYSDDANDPEAFCSRPQCRYKGRGWWCCRCRQRNLAAQTAHCLHRLAPALFVGSPLEELICRHFRCGGGCVDDRQHWFMMEHPEVYNASKEQLRKSDDEGKENKDDDEGGERETVGNPVSGARSE